MINGLQSLSWRLYPPPGGFPFLPSLDVALLTLAGATDLVVMLPVPALAFLYNEKVSKVRFAATTVKTNLVTEPDMGLACATAKQRRLLREFGVHLSASEAAGLGGEAAGRAGLVVVQGNQELSLARAAEAVVHERIDPLLAAGDVRDKLAEVLNVGVSDLGTNAHHQGAEDNDEVLAFLVEQRTAIVVLFSAVLIEELVAKARVKLLADNSRIDVGIHRVLSAGREEIDPGKLLGTGVLRDPASDVVRHILVLVALEHACGFC